MVRIRNLSKRYRLYDSSRQRLAEWVTGRPRHRDFWALRHINLEVPRGVALGVIGPNGAGKSTLLKILSGVTYPTEGTLETEGRVTALLELGTGFHPEFTGRQNIFLNGRLLGFSDQEIQARVGETIAFSELGDFIDQPVRTYSSGMYMRLGFSTMASLNPDVLVIDEIFAVGDAHFQQKCVRRVREFKEQGCTILFVSHDPGAVKNLCDRAILLNHGEIVESGQPDEVLDYYNALLARDHGAATSMRIARQSSGMGPRQRAGTFEAVVTSLDILDAENQPVRAVVAGDPVTLKMRVSFLADIENPTVGMLIRDNLGSDMFGTNTHNLHLVTGSFSVGDELDLDWSFDVNLGPGQYTITVAVHTEDVHLYHCFDWADCMTSFQVLPRTDYHFIGKAHLPSRLSLRRLKGVADLPAVLRSLYPEAPRTLGMMDDKYLLEGWYHVEDAGGRPMRWTEQAFSAVLRGPGSTLVLEASCPRPHVREHPMRGRVYINGAEAGSFEVNSGHVQTVRAPIGRVKDEVVKVEFRLDETWVPDEHGITGDLRKLGIFLSRMQLE